MNGTLLLDLKQYLRFLINQLRGGPKGSPLFYFMNFKEIIKHEWEKEFGEGYEESIFLMYEQMVEKVCVKVWNSALDYVADRALIEEHIPEEERDLEWEESPITISGGHIRNEHYVTIDRNSILQYKINEQGTDTTEV